MKANRRGIFALLLLLVVALGGCRGVPLVTNEQADHSNLAATATLTNGPRMASPQATFTPAPTATLLPAPTAEPTAEIPYTLTLPAPPTPALPLAEALRGLSSQTLLYTRPDRFLMLADMATGQHLWLTERICSRTNTGLEQRGQWSHDGRFLAIVCEDELDTEYPVTYILDMETGAFRDVTVGEISDTSFEAWSPVGPHLLVRSWRYLEDVGTWGATWYVVDALSGETVKLLEMTHSNFDPAWSPDGTQVAIVGNVEAEPGVLYILNRESSNLRQIPLNGVANSYLDGPMSWSADGNFIFLHRVIRTVTGPYIYQVVRVDLNSGAEQIVADGSRPFSQFHWAPDGAWFVAGEQLMGGQYWALYRADGTLERVLSNYPERHIGTARWLPDGRFVTAAVQAGAWQLTASDVEGQERVIANYPISNPPGEGTLALSPDGTLLAFSARDEIVTRVFDLQGQEQMQFEGHVNDWRLQQDGRGQ